MKLVTFAFVIFLSSLSQATITSCKDPETLVPRLYILQQAECKSGYALFDLNGKNVCATFQNEKVTSTGNYRACVKFTMPTATVAHIEKEPEWNGRPPYTIPCMYEGSKLFKEGCINKDGSTKPNCHIMNISETGSEKVLCSENQDLNYTCSKYILCIDKKEKSKADARPTAAPKAAPSDAAQ